MSAKQINHSEDIQKLINDGYTVTVTDGCVIVHDVPYLDESLNVREDGVLVGPHPIRDHTLYFSDVPYTVEKKTLHIAGQPSTWNGHDVKAHLSFKKSDGKSHVPYTDNYDKVTYYVTVISTHARKKKAGVSAIKHKPVDTSSDANTPFMYADTNSSRAGINHVSKKLQGQKVAIVGVGGTGSYVLDFVSKTPVEEIHLYDNDTFHTHNAFRAPGAPSKEDVAVGGSKVEHWKTIYSKMHKGVVAHDISVNKKIVTDEFGNYDFIFLCMDGNEGKSNILLSLIKAEIPFVDCGIAVDEVDTSLLGTIRATTVTPQKNEHLTNRVPSSYSENDIYSSNIQIAELNALNASMAVMKWKRISGFYHDHGTEHHSTFTVNTNILANNEQT